MGKKLLVADDSVTIQKVIKLALSSEGYDILAVSEGKEAIRAIEEERPDVVLIDVTLPGADAYAVKRAVNADPSLANTGFILMLSAFERVDEKAIDEVKFQGRLIKPFDPSHLRKAVADLLAMQSSVAQTTASQSTVIQPASPPPIERLNSGRSLIIETSEEEDFPPVRDEHPTVEDQAQVSMTQDEFEIDAPPRAEGQIIEPQVAERVDSAAPPPPPSVPESEEDAAEAAEDAKTRSLENDIKNLTESTIKMSGLDEFQWNLDDSRKMKSPAPPRAEEPTAEMVRPSATAKNAALRSLTTAPSKPLDDGGSTFPISSLGQNGVPHRKPSTVVIPPDLSSINEPRPQPPQPGGASQSKGNTPPLPISRAEIEQMIRKDLEAALDKLAKEAVPRIAEAIIRQEIEKILNEP